MVELAWMLAALYVAGRLLNARRGKKHQRSVIKQVFTPIWRLAMWLSDRYAVPDYVHRQWVLSDQFYSSKRWKRVRNWVFMMNRLRHGGRLKCEIRGCPKPYGAKEYHGHHLYPRSTHPELALRRDNVVCGCSHCNIRLGNRYVGRELRPNPRLA